MSQTPTQKAETIPSIGLMVTDISEDYGSGGPGSNSYSKENFDKLMPWPREAGGYANCILTK